MAKVTIDGPNRLIVINLGETSISVKEDLYSEWKNWTTQGDNSKYLPAFSVIGGEEISAGKYVGTTYFLENGWRVRPYEGDHVLAVEGNLYTRESGERPVIPTVGSYNVMVELVRSNLVDTIATSGTEIDYDVLANAVWSKLTTDTIPSGSYGNHVFTKLLTLAQYMATK